MVPKEEGKAAFHWALAGIFVPGFGVLVSAVLAASYAFRGGPWARRLALLAGVDLLVLPALLVLASQKDRVPAAPPADAPRIGVVFENDGARVKDVVKGWPAAEAGLRRGDVIQAVDGAAVTREILLRGLPEGERVLRIGRAGETLEVRVTPRRPGAAPLFEAQHVAGGLAVDRKEWIAYGVAAAVVLAAWLGTLRRPGPRVWRGFLLAMGLFTAGSAGASLLVQAIEGGMSRGGFLLAILIGHGILGLGGVVASVWQKADRPAEPPPARPPLRAFGMSVFYTATAYPRAGVLLLAADIAILGGAGKPPDDLQTFAGTLHGPLGVGLFVLAVAVVGPIAEELVFRGFLLPRLAARIGRGWALAATSVVFGCMHASYGLYAALTIVLGWMLGWARLESGGLKAPVALHMLINGAVTAIFFLR